jgi:hypothetical protein
MSDSVLPLFAAKRKAEDAEKPSVKVPRGENGQEAFQENGIPVYKIGWDKYISARPNGKSLAVIIGEWKRLPNGKDYQRTEKGITLTMTQFNRLAGLVMSGRADCPTIEDGVSTMHNLGLGVFFSWSKFNRMNLAHIRYYKKNLHGDKVPTKKGIAFGQRCYDGLKDVLLKLTLHKEAAKLGTETAGLGLEFKPLKEIVRQKLVEIVVKERELLCEACNGSSELEVHSCKLTTPITEVEWTMAESVLKDKKMVEAVLLANDVVSAQQLTTLDIDGFLAANRQC